MTFEVEINARRFSVVEYLNGALGRECLRWLTATGVKLYLRAMTIAIFIKGASRAFTGSDPIPILSLCNGADAISLKSFLLNTGLILK